VIACPRCSSPTLLRIAYESTFVHREAPTIWGGNVINPIPPAGDAWPAERIRIGLRADSITHATVRLRTGRASQEGTATK